MKNIVFDKIKNNEVKIVVNLTIVLIYLYSLLGFIFEYLPTIFESIYYLLLDVLLLICSIIALKNTRNNKLKIFLVFFLTYLLFTYIINLNKLSFFMFLNGVRELIPLLIPIIILQIFKSNQRNVFINKLNRFLHVYLILQIPVSITQFLEHGAGDAVGGTLGTGFSGVMTLIIFLSLYYLIVIRIKNNNFIVAILKNFYLFLYLIPVFVNETKIFIFLIVVFLLLLIPISIRNIFAYIILLLAIPTLIVLSDGLYSRANDDKSVLNDYYSKDYIRDYFLSDDVSYHGVDVPRFQKVILFFNLFDTKEILFGNGLGHFKGGKTMELSSFSQDYQWLVKGSRPYIFFIMYQIGLIGLTLIILYLSIVFRSDYSRKYKKHKYFINAKYYLFIIALLGLFYNEAYRYVTFTIIYFTVYTIVILIMKREIHEKKIIIHK